MPGQAADPAARPELRALRRRPLFASLAVPALLAAAAFAVLAVLWAAQATTTVIVVRHAEKLADGTADPALSAVGQARVQRLVRQLAGARLTAVYSTPYRRTRDTAAPIAAAAGVEVTEVDPKDFDGLAARIGAEQRGRTVLVVGHSNTIGPVVQALGGEAAAEYPEDEYGHLFVVTVPRFGAATTLHLRQ